MANLLGPGTLTRISEGTKEGQTHVQEHWSLVEDQHSNGARLLPPATQKLCTTYLLSTAQGRGY